MYSANFRKSKGALRPFLLEFLCAPPFRGVFLLSKGYHMHLGLGLGFGRSRKPVRALTPAFLPNLQLWLDASDSSSITHATNAVSQWNDKSGNARHVSQGGSGTLKPTYNGTDHYVSFDGGDYLYNTSPFLHASSGYAIYAVIDGTASNYAAVVAEGNSGSAITAFAPFMTGAGGDNGKITPFIVSDGGSALKANGPLGAATSHSGAKKLVRITEEYRVLTAYINGTVNDLPRHYMDATLTLNRFCLGAVPRSTFDYPGTFKLYEIIIAEDDRYGVEIEGYLAHKHGLTSSLPSDHLYKSDAPMTNAILPSIGTIGDAQKAALFGDSISNQNSAAFSTIASYYSYGYFTNYNALSGLRMELPTANNKGISGERTGQMVSRMETDLSGLTFDTCFFMGGTNDIGNDDPESDIVENISRIINYVTMTLGKRMVLMTMLPRTQSGDVSGKQARAANVNAWIMNQHASRRGKVISVDLFSDMDDGTGEPIANSTSDGLHPTPYGAMLCGQRLQASLNPYYDSSAIDFSAGNLLTNGSLAGTGGTVGSNASGSVATGYAFSGSGGTGGRTGSKNANGSQRLVMGLSGGTSSDTMRLSQTVSAGFAVGDTVYGVALVEVSGTPAKIYRNALELRLTGTGVPTLATVSGMENQTDTNFIGEQYLIPGQYYLVTPDLTISSGSSMSLEWRYEMQGDSSSGTSSGTIDIMGAGIFKR